MKQKVQALKVSLSMIVPPLPLQMMKAKDKKLSLQWLNQRLLILNLPIKSSKGWKLATLD